MSTLRSFRRGRGRRFWSIATAGLLIATGLIWIGVALAVHDNGMFELDGNTVHSSATTPPYDWNSLFGATGNRLITPDPVAGPLLADTFVSDAAKPDQTYFTSNKDIQPIASGQQHWGCDPINNPLDKDDLLNAYAALVQVPPGAPDNGGHQVLYLGSERGSNNGTSYAGFWLLKDKNVACSGSNDFSGHHTDGDLLIVSDYTNGGGTQDVTVFRWTGDDANGSLVEQTTFDGSICSANLGNDNACAIANNNPITTPWSPTSHDSKTFVEAGIDLTALLGANGGCFTTFLAETRSSNELTATLKDFAGGQFSTCVQPNIGTTATPGGSLNPTGVATQHDVATITKVGNRPDPTGSITFFLCNPSQVTAGGCVSGGTQVGNAVPIVAGSATSANASGSLTTTTGKYCWRAEYTPDAAGSNFYVAGNHTDATGECFTVVHGTPSIGTQISVTGTNSPSLGFTTLGDSAQLSGFVGSVTGETITFNLYGPYATGVTPTCTGQAAFTTTGTLNANGQATTAQTFQPTQAGTYVWVASYPGDTLNDQVTGKCSDANESVNILAPSLSITKTADATTVSAGDPLGFTVEVSNGGPGVAKNVTLADPLPAGTATDWVISPAYGGPGTCSISGPSGNQELDCSFGNLANGGSASVHVSSSTSFAHCATYDNTATASADNASSVHDDASIECKKPSLSVTKTADASPVNAGDPLGFTVEVSNGGPGTAENVTLADPLPGGTATDWVISPAYAGPGTCSISGPSGSQELDCSFGDLASGHSASVHIASSTSFAACATYDNTATASADNAPDAQDDASIECKKPSLSVTKTADASPVNAGDPIGFTVEVSNGGPGTARSVTLADPLPGGTATNWVISPAYAGPGACSISGPSGSQVLDCAFGDLLSGAGTSVHVSSTTTFAHCATYDNTATASATNAPDAQDDASIECRKPDLTITKTADASPVDAGDPLGFTVEVSNGGPGVAKDVTLADPLPGGTATDWVISPAYAGPGTCAINGPSGSQELDCSFGDLASGHSASVHVSSTTTFAACTTYDNTATASADNAPDAQDSATIECRKPDLSVTKTADAASVNAGDPLGFTVEVSNGGPGTAKNVTLADPLPGGTATDWVISPAYAGPGTCSISGPSGSQELDCSFGDLASGHSASVHVSSTTTFAHCTKYDNTATASADNAPDAQDDASITCVKPGLNVVKTADAATVDAGDDIGFTVDVSNAGPGIATDVTLADPLPGGTATDWVISPAYAGPGTCSISGPSGSQVLNCSFGDLAVNADASVHVSSSTTFAHCTTYDNTATASASNAPDAQDDASIECRKPDLSVTKTADAATVDAGDPLGFTVEVSNGGPGTAKDVTLADPLPGGTATDWVISPAYAGPGTCSISGPSGSQELDCSFGDLASGDSATVHVSSTTTFAHCTKYDNTATASADNAPDAQDDASIQCRKPDLTITKTADAATVDAGDPIGFTIDVANNGAGTAKDVTLADPLPGGTATDWVISPAYAGPGTCSISGPSGSQVLDCSFGDLASGDSATVHVSSTTTFAHCTKYDNTATASADNAPDAQDDASIQCRKPDLTITKTADAATVDAGDPIGFTIDVANNGPGTAKDATLADPLPGGTATDWVISPAYAGPGTCSISGPSGSQVLDCSFGDLASGDSATVHVSSTTSAAACTSYDNTGTASADNAPDVSDSASIDCLAPGLSVNKTADANTVDAGDPIGFTVEVSNGGPGTATNATLTDPLPAGTATDWVISPAYAGPGTCAINGPSGNQELDCSFGDLAAKTTVSVHVTAGTSFAACTDYDNTATAHADNAPPADDSASIVCQAPSLSVTKTADAASVNAGDPIGFTVEVSNGGPGKAKGVTLADPLPAGTATDWLIDPAYAGPGTCSISGAPGHQELDCSFGDLASGDSTSVHVMATTSAAACTTYDNTATASATNAPDAEDSASIQCSTAVVSITKTADHSAPVNAGGQIGFTVEVKNAGPGTATGVTLHDPLPAGSGSGVTWAIDAGTGTPAQFVLSGAKGSQTLSLASSRLPAGADYKVHVVASTSETECGTYDNTATLTTGNANNPNPASASESCGFHVDLSVTKAGSPATQTLGDGNITWTIVVTNNGPDTDTGVTIADPMPAGNTFVSAISSKGSCTGGAILHCTIGSMAAGEKVTITLVTTPSTVGAQTNSVTVSGSRPETNTTNNTASATVQTVGVITPPVTFCVAVSKVTPKQLFVGRKTKLKIHVTKHGRAVKGVHVRIKGPKINMRTKASNRKGVITARVKMKKAGILIFSPIASKRCNTKRVGVTNVFTPPVTG